MDSSESDLREELRHMTEAYEWQWRESNRLLVLVEDMELLLQKELDIASGMWDNM